MLTDFLAGVSFYLVPFLTGRIFIKNPVFAYVLGALLWLVGFFIFSAELLRVSIILISALSIIKIGADFLKKRPEFPKTDALPTLVLIIFSSLIYFLIWKKYTPYPLQLNWDIYEHITLSNEIVKGNISFLTTRISDTFTVNSYSPIFSVLLSIPKILFQKSLIGIYWWLEYLNFVLTGLASYFLAKRFLKDRFIALGAGLISALTFQSIVAYTTLFLLPQTLTALIAVLLIGKTRLNLKWLVVSSVFLFLLHYIIGTLAIIILWSFYIGERLKPREKLNKLALMFSVLSSVILLGLNFLGKWELLNTEEATHFNFAISEKIGFMLDWYSLFIFLLPLGVIYLIRKGEYESKIFLVLTLFVFSLALAPFSYFLKFYVLGHYLINVVLIAGFALLIANFSRFLKVLSLSTLALAMAYVFYINQKEYKKPLHFGSFETQISVKEIEAGKWLSKNADSESFIISDPSLQYVLEAVSGINSQGGTYMRLDARQALDRIKNSNSTPIIKRELLSISDTLQRNRKDVYFVVGGRYFDWQRSSDGEKNSTFYNIWSPRTISDQDRSYIEFLEESNEFEKVYENSELVVFKLI